MEDQAATRADNDTAAAVATGFDPSLQPTPSPMPMLGTPLGGGQQQPIGQVGPRVPQFNIPQAGQNINDRAVFSMMSESLRERNEALQQIRGSMGTTDRLNEERNTALAPYYGALDQQFAKPRPIMPQLQQMPPPPAAMTQQDSQQMMAFASAAAVLGAIGSKFVRMPANAALNAFAGAINGYKQGNQQAFDDQMKVWHANVERTKENNKTITDTYRNILEDRSLGIEELKTRMLLAATKYQDQIMAEAAKRGDFIQMANIHDKLIQSGLNWSASANRMFPQATIPDEVARRVAKQYNDGNQQAAQGWNAGISGSANMIKLQEFITADAKERNITPEMQNANFLRYQATGQAMRTTAQRGAGMIISAHEAEQFAPQFLAASERLWGKGDFRPFNQVALEANKLMSTTEYADFQTWRRALVTAYGSALSRTGVNTVYAQEAGAEQLDQARGHRALVTTVEAMVKEMRQIEGIPQHILDRMVSQRTGEDLERPSFRWEGSGGAREQMEREGRFGSPEGPAGMPGNLQQLKDAGRLQENPSQPGVLRDKQTGTLYDRQTGQPLGQ